MAAEPHQHIGEAGAVHVEAQSASRNHPSALYRLTDERGDALGTDLVGALFECVGGSLREGDWVFPESLAERVGLSDVLGWIRRVRNLNYYLISAPANRPIPLTRCAGGPNGKRRRHRITQSLQAASDIVAGPYFTDALWRQ